MQKERAANGDFDDVVSTQKGVDPSGNGAAAGERKVPVWEQRKKLDPKDFIASGCANETIVRMPGSIQGQQFVIEGLENCTLLLLDNMDSVQMDDCINCRVYAAPVEGSFYMRGCTDCTIVASCRQLRTRLVLRRGALEGPPCSCDLCRTALERPPPPAHVGAELPSPRSPVSWESDLDTALPSGSASSPSAGTAPAATCCSTAAASRWSSRAVRCGSAA